MSTGYKRELWLSELGYDPFPEPEPEPDITPKDVVLWCVGRTFFWCFWGFVLLSTLFIPTVGWRQTGWPDWLTLCLGLASSGGIFYLIDKSGVGRLPDDV